MLELMSVMMLNWSGVGCQPAAIMLGLRNAPVAQLDRAAASEAVGQKFESSRAHHSFLLFSGKILAGGASAF
jgi:hypothetical protein